ncbi:hypothetical protein M427DRAFT_210334 [Gonapodya prolifera JEL478]|uniref:Uncharacterized protein n=1 Tax=Gonapodya prolifera (strain JEL478) TaxID=1344416 RepID=A0A139ANT9_GONPJ|nr:hypothetical protein M427DRAFT_210334 [Gonapodya prolifera JEL478]|eukprot:KXS18427.1 hypothetical protein M427DRAFT_210334 [Gonapodya prolifera JEL478]
MVPPSRGGHRGAGRNGTIRNEKYGSEDVERKFRNSWFSALRLANPDPDPNSETVPVTESPLDAATRHANAIPLFLDAAAKLETYLHSGVPPVYGSLEEWLKAQDPLKNLSDASVSGENATKGTSNHPTSAHLPTDTPRLLANLSSRRAAQSLLRDFVYPALKNSTVAVREYAASGAVSAASPIPGVSNPFGFGPGSALGPGTSGAGNTTPPLSDPSRLPPSLRTPHLLAEYHMRKRVPLRLKRLGKEGNAAKVDRLRDVTPANMGTLDVGRILEKVKVPLAALEPMPRMSSLLFAATPRAPPANPPPTPSLPLPLPLPLPVIPNLSSTTAGPPPVQEHRQNPADTAPTTPVKQTRNALFVPGTPNAPPNPAEGPSTPKARSGPSTPLRRLTPSKPVRDAQGVGDSVLGKRVSLPRSLSVTVF